MSIQRFECELCGEVYWTGDYHDCAFDMIPLLLTRQECQEVAGILKAAAGRVGACGGDMQMRMGAWRGIADSIERAADDVGNATRAVREWLERMD